MIRVIYKNQVSGAVEDLHLEELIATEKIEAFYRSNERVDIGRGSVRGMGGEYHGPERRKSAQHFAQPSNFFG